MRKPWTTTAEQEITAAFKAKCALNGEKMNDVLEALMLAYAEGLLIETEKKLVIKKVKQQDDQGE